MQLLTLWLGTYSPKTETIFTSEWTTATKVTDRNVHNGALNFVYFAVLQTKVAYKPALFHVLNTVRA